MCNVSPDFSTLNYLLDKIIEVNCFLCTSCVGIFLFDSLRYRFQAIMRLHYMSVLTEKSSIFFLHRNKKNIYVLSIHSQNLFFNYKIVKLIPKLTGD
jgi:hypothetical protein